MEAALDFVSLPDEMIVEIVHRMSPLTTSLFSFTCTRFGETYLEKRVSTFRMLELCAIEDIPRLFDIIQTEYDFEYSDVYGGNQLMEIALKCGSEGFVKFLFHHDLFQRYINAWKYP